MSPAPCPRRWEAEALEDGRLSEADRLSFERHLPACPCCAAEAEAMARLSAIFQSMGVSSPSPLARRRERVALLQRANERLVGSRAARSPRLVASLLLAVALPAALLAWSRLGARPGHARLVEAPAGPAFRGFALRDALWQSEIHGATTEVTLLRGQAAFQVDKLTSLQRFLLHLPDGELEVRGTSFVVTLEEGRTAQVSVSEGSVWLGLRGRPAVTLAAGEGWAASPGASALGAAAPPGVREGQAPGGPGPGSPAPEPTPRTRPLAPSPPDPAASAPAPAVSRPPPSGPLAIAPSAAASAPPAQEERGRSFAAAMEAFQAGDYARADALFAAFLAVAGGDARAEDASFLRAVASARRGDRASAQRLAEQYLWRYPRGFRRREAERLRSGE